MRCDQAQQLFDAYLDSELSPSLATELGAHRIRCPECRQALALLEVSGHIVRTDQEPVQLERNFTDRLLGCMEKQTTPWFVRWRREIYIAGPLAAAAVISMAFLGAFDNSEPKVAGVKAIGVERPAPQAPVSLPEATPLDAPGAADVNQEMLEAWVDQARNNIAIKRESGASLRQLLDQTATQWGHILEDAGAKPAPAQESTGSESPVSPTEEGDPDPDVDDDTDG